MELKDPINSLIEFLSKELHQEIVYNDDSSQFWKKAQIHIFDNSIASIRESINSLSEAIGEDPDLFNYFSSFTFRVFSQPFARPAIKNFSEGFDEIGMDVFFREALSITSKDLTLVEQFLLFLSVHRNQIQLMMIEAEEFKADMAKKAAREAKRR